MHGGDTDREWEDGVGDWQRETQAKGEGPQPPSAPSSPSLTLVIAEHFHAGLCVGVVGWLEAQLCDSCRGWPRQADDLRVTIPGPPTLPACMGLTAHPAW